MRRSSLLLALPLVLAAGCGGSETVTVTSTRTETVTVTRTETVTETVESAPAGLPAPVAKTYEALRAAAASGDYEELRPLIPARGFSYTFGLPAEGGPIEYWQRIERETDESPIRRLAQILDLPYTLYAGIYTWPFAHGREPESLTPYERRILGDLADDFGSGSGYLGWRTGIRPNSTWTFFIAGD